MVGLVSAALYFYKDDIIYMATMQINKHLNTKVDVSKKIDISIFEKFPELSVGFHEVKCYEPNTSKSTIFASLDAITITFDLIEVWNGIYSIDKLYLKKGYIHLRTDQDGTHNFMIFKKDTSSKDVNADFSISYIQLNNIEFIYDNRTSDHIYQTYIKDADAGLTVAQSLYSIRLASDVHSDRFTIKEYTFFQNKDFKIASNVFYNAATEVLSIAPSTLQIQGVDFEIKGLYDIKKSEIDISFNANKNSINKFTSLLPSAFAKNIQEYQSSGNVYFDGTMKGSMDSGQNPAIKVSFGFDNATFYHPVYKQKITDASLTGLFNNGDERDLSTTSLRLSNIKMKSEGKFVSGYINMSNFDNPYIDSHLKGGVALNNVLRFIPNHKLEQASGDIDFDIEFKGYVNDLKSRQGYSRIQTTGDLTFKNIKTKIASYPHVISIGEASCIFTKNDISIDNMHLSVGKNEVVLTGMFRNLIGKLIFPNQSVYVQADLEMGNIFLEEILMANTRNKKSSDQNFIMPALKDFKLDLNLNAKSMNYQKLHASNIQSKIDWDYPYLNFTNTRLSFCNGLCTGKTSMKVLSEKVIEINTDSKIQSMDIDSLFYVFENFSQDFITNKNLRGKITTDVSLILQLDNHLNILPSSIVCDADITIQNGELNNFETLQRVARFLDAEDLNNIKFSEIKNHFLIYNEEIQIPDMTIVSTAGKISFSGTHNFDGRIAYHVAYPIKNLKKEKVDSDAAFGALRADSKGEMKLFLIVQGTTSDFKISYDKKKTSEKIKADLQKEKNELKALFKKKEEDLEEVKQGQDQEYFDFD
jgi:uncharacterized protein involved in outer membrane biogenesis